MELENIDQFRFPCMEFLGESKRDGVIPLGTKGLFIQHDDITQFIPLIKQEILPGKYPEISRTNIELQNAQLTRQQHTLADLRIMLNEIYARYGYRFRPGGEMDVYFSAQPWYTPKYDNVDAFLTKVEKSNAILLRQLQSPDIQAQKARFIKEVTSFCQTLKNDDIAAISQYISENLSIGADESVSLSQFIKILPEFKHIMLTSTGNCAQNLDRFIQNTFFDLELYSPFLNANFTYDDVEKKYALVYLDLDESCIPESSEIVVDGTLGIKNYLDDTNHESKTMVRKIIFKSFGMPRCIEGTDINLLEDDNYVQLQLSKEDETRFAALAGKKVTLRGLVRLATSQQDYTPLKLENVILESIKTEE